MIRNFLLENLYFLIGKYKEDKVYNLYIQMITCSFKIKKNKIPTIQIKHNLNYKSNEYLETSNRWNCLFSFNKYWFKIIFRTLWSDRFNLRMSVGNLKVYKEFLKTI